MSQSAGKPDGSDSTARKSCMFYKLMVASILQDKKLKIPKKFVNKYGDELSSIATLTAPCGGICLVELQEVNGKLWFHKGWHEFVECYSIRVGYFLVFLYEGKSNFNVHMYDLTVSEVKNPCNSISQLQESSHDNPCLLPHEKDDGLKKILGFRPPSPNLLSSTTSKNFNEYVHCNCTQSTYTAGLEKPHVRTDAYNLRENCQSSRDIGTQFNGEELTSTEDGVGSIISGITAKPRGNKRMNVDKHESLGIQTVKQKSTRVKNTFETLTRRQRAVTPEEKERTIRAAHMFRPDNPFFQVILRPSYVYRGFLLHIPSSFARTFLNRVTGFVTLQVCDGKQWPVRCSFKDGKAKLGQGWTEFVWENNLEEGDVCIFELIHAKEIVMKVAIFRVLEDAVPPDQLSN
uniref:TF-B3 domain-containing protein n=1 Tax=Salix viminalis TaxID=40686 RepID=A0A6N2LC47_SALVM